MSTPSISVFDLFKIGIGPSSSHTVGPMKAARQYLSLLQESGSLDRVRTLRVSLYGSLALTGIGHGTDKAILLGLAGHEPDQIDPGLIEPIVRKIRADQKIPLLGAREIDFDPSRDLVWHRNQNLPGHPNGMRFEAWDGQGHLLQEHLFYSIGGGFITCEGLDPTSSQEQPVPHPFRTGEDLLRIGRETGLKLWQIVHENELVRRTPQEIHEGVKRIAQVMKDCIERGFHHPGNLPGGMKVRRRAPDLFKDLRARQGQNDPLDALDWVNAFAISVNEENAAFGRVVTAPTNGAAGIIPSCLEYYRRFLNGDDEGVLRFFLTATAVGTLYKLNASISGAEVGCQGEVGVASSMAAAALAEVMGGSNEHIENAAEIAMEHHLGMTCDPVGGLVQIPCIERNAMGAVKALNAARMSLKGDGQHAISLDRVIKTMWDTGQDMSTKYKETSRGGLAVNVPEC
ncbi:MAG: L-serine ammonia-lyase [Bdellovibrionaceae bacterium]|nr:L-serine ammonia-lyase [Pseudobdellovibrionaceae bacterium]